MITTVIMKRLTKGFHSRYEKNKIIFGILPVNLTGLVENNMISGYLRLIVWFFWVVGATTAWGAAVAASDEAPTTIELESGIYYTVKKGDTLWDISNRYFNTHWRWPQIWSENQQIMNPHRIFPGERLRLYHQVWEASLPPESSDQPVSSSLDRLPVIETRYYVYSSIHRIGFIKDQPVATSGHVSLIRGDKVVQKTMLGQDEIIYVAPSGNVSLQVGDVYAVYRPPTQVKDTETKNIIGEPKNIIGVQYYKTGLIRIVESHEDYAVAKIEKAFRSIMVNDILLPYEPVSPKIQLTPVTAQIDGKVFKAEEDIEIFGDDAIAFINKGVEDGIQTGQTYAIYEEYVTESMRDFFDYGSLLVLRTEATTSTVLIMRSDRSIRPPGRFRSPPALQNP
jgi:hypothetical protein